METITQSTKYGYDTVNVEKNSIPSSVTEIDSSTEELLADVYAENVSDTLVSSVPWIAADNEWSLLKSVIIGRAENSYFPHMPHHMLAATMPPEHHSHFQPDNPFPSKILLAAQQELDNFAELLEDEGIQVFRPKKIDWQGKKGYTGAMPRDGLLVVGNTVIESCFAWDCRQDEVMLGLGDLLTRLGTNPALNVVRASKTWDPDMLYEDVVDGKSAWAINNSRVAFDAADFMRFGKTLIGQISNVTNQKGVEYIQQHVPEGYVVEILEVDDPHAMHIDATILPLREGLLIYNPERVTVDSLRRHEVFKGWELVPYPFVESVKKKDKLKEGVPRFMTSAWIVINVLVLGNNRVVIEESDEEFGAWLESRSMKVIRAPFRNVHAIGGSFHCASVDLVRE
jgi:glycine amidinotransferase